MLEGGGGGSKKNEGNPRGVYKIHIWTITNSSGPPQVINTDWSLKLAVSENEENIKKAVVSCSNKFWLRTVSQRSVAAIYSYYFLVVDW